MKNNSKSLTGRRSVFTTVAMSIGTMLAVGVAAHIAGAAVVSGTMSYRNGSAATKRQLHYENRVTGDMYVAPTTTDGTFSADLPPGLYDLRAERGVVLKRKIRVDAEDMNVGHVVEPVPLDVHRLFQHEGVAEAIVTSPAPSTANLTGRPLQGMRYGHDVTSAFGAPVGTPVPRETPLGEATPAAAPSPAAMMK